MLSSAPEKYGLSKDLLIETALRKPFNCRVFSISIVLRTGSERMEQKWLLSVHQHSLLDAVVVTKSHCDSRASGGDLGRCTQMEACFTGVDWILCRLTSAVLCWEVSWTLPVDARQDGAALVADVSDEVLRFLYKNMYVAKSGETGTDSTKTEVWL